ncbi:Secoisolariciresinol dehydrogenase [Thalictrum thalictroides]|uniref:Secoisolariciresinol dehydrogenase n=1 Tax=Thalictrum thalictroides TaxID=46969 RepID=A0A7J6V8S5_THATH|nr:Secoisolariciresinol dehydrogenase [Thalictrum thalictroides]
MGSNSIEAPLAKRLEGKVALITGGSNGIGACTALLFIRHGAKVVIADIDENLGYPINQVGLGENLYFIHCDVTKETEVENAVDTTIAKYGKLDIMFNNAGIGGKPGGQIHNVTGEDLKQVFDINVNGSFYGAKHAARVMIPQKKGTIIFNSSASSAIILGEVPHAYTMSKHAVVGLSKSLGVELGQYGIRVNTVSSYGCATPMFKDQMNEGESKWENLWTRAANLKGVVLKAEDVADAVLFLASEEAKYVSGLNLVLDGGYSTTNPSFSMAVKANLENAAKQN